ncbi:hypothetical protein AAII07_31445 [Microvirga sp. 0TCS3.31]
MADAKMGAAVTDLKSLKEVIGQIWRDGEMASSACYGIDAYARLWPFVYMVNDWGVWDEQRKGLKPEVVAWLEHQGRAWDFYHLLDAWSLVGFKDPKAASHFKLRWSGVLKAATSSSETWNPRPYNSPFAPLPYENPTRSRQDRRNAR